MNASHKEEKNETKYRHMLNVIKHDFQYIRSIL
jgi:hypothetical protein